MANTYTSLFYHIVFSTKGRVPCIQPAIAPRIWEYIGGVARAHKVTALQVGGIADHAHVLIMAPPTIAPLLGKDRHDLIREVDRRYFRQASDFNGNGFLYIACAYSHFCLAIGDRDDSPGRVDNRDFGIR